MNTATIGLGAGIGGSSGPASSGCNESTGNASTLLVTLGDAAFGIGRNGMVGELPL